MLLVLVLVLMLNGDVVNVCIIRQLIFVEILCRRRTTCCIDSCTQTQVIVAISRRHRVAVRQDALFPQVEGGTLEQGAHQLVRVPSQAVSSLHPGKSARSMGLRHEETSSPGGVDVQPDVVLLADVGDRVDRIKGSHDCRPRRAVDKEG